MRIFAVCLLNQARSRSLTGWRQDSSVALTWALPSAVSQQSPAITRAGWEQGAEAAGKDRDLHRLDVRMGQRDGAFLLGDDEAVDLLRARLRQRHQRFWTGGLCLVL